MSSNDTNADTALATIPQGQVDTLRAIMGSIERILPPHIGLDEFRGALMLHLQTGKKLASCTPESIVDCVLKAASSGWLPKRDCAFVAFWDGKKKVNVATCIPGYQGMTRELYATGSVLNVPPPQIVRDGDRFEVDLGANTVTHVPKYGGPRRAEQTIIAFWASAVLASQEKTYEVMDVSEVEAVRDRVKDWEKTPWATDFGEMGRKTVFRRLYKRLQMPRAVPVQTGPPDPDSVRSAIHDLFGTRITQEVLQGRPTAALPESPPEVVDAPEAIDTETGEVEGGEYDDEESAALDAELAAQEQMELEAQAGQ